MSVLAEGDVADPVQLVLDDPVPADELTDTAGGGSSPVRSPIA